MFLLVGGLGWDETGFFSQGLSDGCSQGVARSWNHLQVLPTDPPEADAGCWWDSGLECPQAASP